MFHDASVLRKGDLCPFQHGPPLELPSFTGTELPAAFRAILAQAPQQPGGLPPVASLPTLPRAQWQLDIAWQEVLELGFMASTLPV